MKRIRIGTSGLQIAVILEQVKPRAGTYKVAKVVLGKYDNDSCIFKDEEGNLYKHFIRYDTNEKEPAYFIGRMPLPAFSELIIKDDHIVPIDRVYGFRAQIWEFHDFRIRLRMVCHRKFVMNKWDCNRRIRHTHAIREFANRKEIAHHQRTFH